MVVESFDRLALRGPGHLAAIVDGRHNTPRQDFLRRGRVEAAVMDPTADFFNRVIQQHARLVPRGVTATLRIDLEREDGGIDHWLVVFGDGTLRVSMEERSADCTIRASKELFDHIVTGEMNMMAATFRNLVRVEGDLLVWSVFRKLLPGPPGARDPRDFFRERRAQRR